MTKINFNLNIMNNYTRIHVSILDKTEISFMLYGQLYIYEITKWHGRGKYKFIKSFHAYKKRSKYEFGELIIINDEIKTFNINKEQINNCYIQGCKDIIICLEQLIEKNKKCIIDYAIYFCKKIWPNELKKTDYNQIEYDKYITNQTCNMIIDVKFILPNIHWDVLYFH